MDKSGRTENHHHGHHVVDPEKQRQKKIVEAIKMGMSLDPNMTPEMIEEYTPAIEQIIMTYAKYGK